jgi:glyoxylase-like metal-dependent hydrolase (beta-lactamase superfamily II)
MSIKVKNYIVGTLETNAYVVYDTDSREAMIIDPGAEPDFLYENIKNEKLNLKYIIATHGHFDHVLGINRLRTLTNAKSCMSVKDLEIMKYLFSIGLFVVCTEPTEMPVFDFYLDENTEFKIGSTIFKVIVTPGHSPGGICIYGAGMLFSGDTLFYRGEGRTDIAEGNEKMLQKSLLKLMRFDENTIVYPGHGPITKISEEKRFNRLILKNYK